MLAYLVIGILTGAAYGLLAVSFVLVYKGTRIFNLAQGEIGAFGLYFAWVLTDRGVPVAVAALAGVVLAGLTGLTMERLLVRRLVDSTPLAALAATLGAGLTLAYMESIIWGWNIKTFPSPFGTWRWKVGSLTITSTRVAALVVAAIVATGLVIFLRRTRFGLAVQAATSDQVLARLSGVRVNQVRSFVWALGGALAGVAAILLAAVYTFHPLSTTLILVRALTAAMLGGLTSLPGAFVGGLVIGIAESVVISQTGVGGTVDLIVFMIMLGVLILRPGGIFGAQEA